MFAHYVVALVKGALTPFIVFPGDSKGLNRPLEALEDFDLKNDVVSAGVISWSSGPDGKVTCYGRGDVVVSNFPRKAVTHRSRGHEDTQLFQEMLSQPLAYLVLRFTGRYHPVILRPGDTPDVQLLRQFQIWPDKVVLGGGWVDFGLSSGAKPVCYGSATFKDGRLRATPFLEKQSRGIIDWNILEMTFVKPEGNPRYSGFNELAFL